MLTCFSGGGRVVDYALMLACDLSLVNVFKVDSLSPDSDHKPLYLELAIPHFTNRCHGVKDKKRCIIRPSYEKTKMHANEVENHLLNLSLNNDVKENWQYLKDIILKVGYQYFKRHVGGHKMSSFPLLWTSYKRVDYKERQFIVVLLISRKLLIPYHEVTFGIEW